MTINIQSVSDLVTNSSTVTFQLVSFDALEALEEIVNAILKVGESDKTFKDLFEASREYDLDFLGSYIEYVECTNDADFSKIKLPEVHSYDELYKLYDLFKSLNLSYKTYSDWCNDMCESGELAIDELINLRTKSGDAEVDKVLHKLNYLFGSDYACG
jgi:hypothetical protein